MRFIDEELTGEHIKAVVSAMPKTVRLNVNRLRPRANHRLFEWNWEKGTLTEVEPEVKAHLEQLSRDGSPSVQLRGELILHQNCMYFSKLNRDNALAYVLKLKREGTEKYGKP